MPLPPAPIFDLMLDREACYRVARGLGLVTPESFAPQNAANLDALLPALDFPRSDYVIKTGVHDAMADLTTQRHTKVGGPDAATRLLRTVGLYGVATVEFRRDPATGALTVIKIDPRIVRATSLSASLGMDVPAAVYRTFALGEHLEP